MHESGEFMGSLDNAFRMLFMLKENKIMKAKDIADKLEVNEKQVRRYKEILDPYFNIESIPGKNGGYKISENSYFPFREILSKEEIDKLKEFINGLDSNYLCNNPELMKIIGKINFTLFDDSDEQGLDVIIPYSRVNKAYDEKIFNEIYLSILDSTEALIKYKDNNGKISERRIQPYKFFTYKGEKYLIAFCLLRNQIRYFKLRRIIEFIKTSFKFEKKIDVDKIIDEHRENSIGIFAGKIYNIILEIKYPMANTIKERIWVENQIVDDTSYDDRIIFKALMKGGPELDSWILSMGDCVKIIEPAELKEKIHEKLEKMIKNI